MEDFKRKKHINVNPKKTMDLLKKMEERFNREVKQFEIDHNCTIRMDSQKIQEEGISLFAIIEV